MEYDDLDEEIKKLTEKLKEFPELPKHVKDLVSKTQMPLHSVLWQLIGWHSQAWETGTTDQKMGAWHFFQSMITILEDKHGVYSALTKQSDDIN